MGPPFSFSLFFFPPPPFIFSLSLSHYFIPAVSMSRTHFCSLPSLPSSIYMSDFSHVIFELSSRKEGVQRRVFFYDLATISFYHLIYVLSLSLSLTLSLSLSIYNKRTLFPQCWSSFI